MIGERVNNYQIISLLGEGGMGAVYLAEHPFMGRKAAIKVLRREFAEDRGLVDRFMNEARAANAIRHANIIDIIDVGQLPSGIPYLMMEFLDGESLAKRIATCGKLSVTEAVDITLQTATALAAAHSKGIVHRDLKPDNLFLLPDDSKPSGHRVKVLDFGIAKLRGDLNGSAAKTQSGSLMGTPPYMSPEQCRGLPDEIDERTDIYALGIILYELLCGAPPFVSPGWGDIVLMHITQAPVSPRSRNPEIPRAVEAVILKALAKERDQRFASMHDLQIALRAAMLGVVAVPAVADSAAVSRPASITEAGVATSKSITTFRTGTGEVVPLLRDDPAPSPKRRVRTPLFVAVGGLVVLGAVGGGAMLASKQHAQPHVAAARGAATLSTGAVHAFGSGESPPPPPPRPPSSSSSTPAPPPAKVSERPASIPADTTVIDVKSGKVDRAAIETAPKDGRAGRDKPHKQARQSNRGNPPGSAIAGPSGKTSSPTVVAPAPASALTPPAVAAPAGRAKPAAEKW